MMKMGTSSGQRRKARHPAPSLSRYFRGRTLRLSPPHPNSILIYNSPSCCREIHQWLSSRGLISEELSAERAPPKWIYFCSVSWMRAEQHTDMEDADGEQ